MLLLLSAALAAAPALDAAPDLSPLRLDPTVLTLESGLTLIIHEDHRAPRVALSMRLRVGAAEDPAGQSGSAHLFEHLMFEGTPAVPSGDYDRLLAEGGASNNAWTDHDWTVYKVDGPAGVLERALWLEADRLRDLRASLSEESLENQRAVVLNERLRDEVSDATYPLYALSWALWPEGHPYRLPVLGTRDELSSMSTEGLEAFAAAWYQPSNVVLSVVGDVDTAELIAMAEATFGALPSAPAPARRPPPPLPNEQPWLLGEARHVMLEDVAEQALYVAWPTVPRGHPDEPALDLLAAMLSGGRGTPLDDRLYYSGRASGVGVWTSNGRLGGDFVFMMRRDDARLSLGLRQLDRALDAIREAPPSAEALARARARWWASSLRALERYEAVAEALGDCFVTWGDADCMAEELERALAVTPQDIQRVANTWLGEGRVVLSVVSPSETRYAIHASEEVSPP